MGRSDQPRPFRKKSSSHNAGTCRIATPYETLYNKRPHMSLLRTFGSTAFLHVLKEKRSGKFSERAQKGYLVGFDNGNSYRVYRPETSTIVVSRDVIIYEDGLEHRRKCSNEEEGSENLKCGLEMNIVGAECTCGSGLRNENNASTNTAQTDAE